MAAFCVSASGRILLCHFFDACQGLGNEDGPGVNQRSAGLSAPPGNSQATGASGPLRLPLHLLEVGCLFPQMPASRHPPGAGTGGMIFAGYLKRVSFAIHFIGSRRWALREKEGLWNLRLKI